MAKIKALYERHRELILYLVFGVLTTLVGWAVYFALFWSWKAVFGLSETDTTDALYVTGYTVAQVVQWTAAVLFAFFTNRKWVFTDADRDVPVFRQLLTFAAGRVVTFFLDYIITYFGAMLLLSLAEELSAVTFAGVTFNAADVIAKVIAAVVVIILNYIFSKLLVFRKKKTGEDGAEK